MRDPIGQNYEKYFVKQKFETCQTKTENRMKQSQKGYFLSLSKKFHDKVATENENENEKGNFQKAKHILNLKS